MSKSISFLPADYAEWLASLKKLITGARQRVQDAFPDMKVFSVRNLYYMRFFTKQCPLRDLAAIRCPNWSADR